LLEICKLPKPKYSKIEKHKPSLKPFGFTGCICLLETKHTYHLQNKCPVLVIVIVIEFVIATTGMANHLKVIFQKSITIVIAITLKKRSN